MIVRSGARLERGPAGRPEMIEAGDYFALQASMQPQRQAVRDLTSGEILTYRDLDAQVGRCAAACARTASESATAWRFWREIAPLSSRCMALARGSGRSTFPELATFGQRNRRARRRLRTATDPLRRDIGGYRARESRSRRLRRRDGRDRSPAPAAGRSRTAIADSLHFGHLRASERRAYQRRQHRAKRIQLLAAGARYA